MIKGAGHIPAEVIKSIAGGKETVELRFIHDGEFGFTAGLSINVDKKNAGKYANLFYYNETSKKLEEMNYAKIAEDGTSELTFSHASDYLIVISEKPMIGKESITVDGKIVANPINAENTAASAAPQTGDPSLNGVGAMLILGTLFLLAAAAEEMRKKKFW